MSAGKKQKQQHFLLYGDKLINRSNHHQAQNCLLVCWLAQLGPQGLFPFVAEHRPSFVVSQLLLVELEWMFGNPQELSRGELTFRNRTQ